MRYWKELALMLFWLTFGYWIWLNSYKLLVSPGKVLVSRLLDGFTAFGERFCPYCFASELTCAGRRKEFDQRSIWSCYSCDQPCTLGLRTQMQDLIFEKRWHQKKNSIHTIASWIVLPHLRFTILDASQLDWWKNCSPGGATCTRSM